MHRLLEDYLADVAAHLSPLPKAQRDEELWELREHLLNAVTVNREQGQSEDEAARAALEQFGAPDALGDNIVWAWRRGELIRKRSFWGAAVSTPAVLGYLIYLVAGSGLLNRVWPSFNECYLAHPAYTMAVIHGLFFLCYGLTGMIVGGVFPKQAVKGLCLGLAFFTLVQPLGLDGGLCWLVFALTGAAVGVAFPSRAVRIVCVGLVVVALLWMGRGGLTVPTQPRQFLFRLEETSWWLATILSAWAVSRWRGRHARPGRV